MKSFLLAYLLLFFGLTIALPSYRVWKSTGVTPYKFGASGSAHDYIGALFRLTLIATAVIVVMFAFLPNLSVPRSARNWRRICHFPRRIP